MNVLAPRDAYRLWAPTYAAETVISFIDEQLTRVLSPPPRDLRLLDAGCGTGRRLPCAAALAVGVDASPEMLAAGGGGFVAAADIRALPFADGDFDLVWCRLVLGHVADPVPAYRELARVCRPGGHVLVSDFHADITRRGHRRSFRDRNGDRHEVEHHVHDGTAHIKAAARASLTARAARDGVVDAAVEGFYRDAGRLADHERDFGRPMVAAFLFQRM